MISQTERELLLPLPELKRKMRLRLLTESLSHRQQQRLKSALSSLLLKRQHRALLQSARSIFVCCHCPLSLQLAAQRPQPSAPLPPHAEAVASEGLPLHQRAPAVQGEEETSGSC